jgi:hypothetical protein
MQEGAPDLKSSAPSRAELAQLLPAVSTQEFFW